MALTRREPPAFAPGTVLGERFEIVRAVGSGGMGTVYEVIDRKLDRRVALKCALPGHRYRLPPEARAAREVSHYNVCKVHELHTLSTNDGVVDCLSMEFIAGETLAQRLCAAGPLASGAAREIGRQICAGLAQAHRQGVVHGDLKPANVILTRSPEGHMRAVITDFGLARITAETRDDTVSGGTRDYMAPENFLGEPPSVPSDLYALGALFHAMLTGHAPRRVGAPPVKEQPWSGDSEESTRTVGYNRVDATVWRREIEPLPSPWKKAVTTCLAALPAQRPGSVAAVVEILEPRRRTLKAAAVLVCGVSLVAGGSWWKAHVQVTPVRLAILPFTVEGDRSEITSAIGDDVAERLAGARNQFTVFSPSEATRNHAETPEAAQKKLGATHVLETRLRLLQGSITATTSLVNLETKGKIGGLDGSYAAGDTPILAKALVGMVSKTFHLPPGAPRESVSDAAYPYYVQGNRLLHRDHADAANAIPLFTKAAELDPRSALPYAGLAEAQIQQIEAGNKSQIEAAEAAAAKAASISPDSVPVLLASSFVAQQLGQYERAIRSLTRATEIAPNDPDTWRRLGLCYEQANRPDDALAAYQKAIKAKPDYYRPYLTLGTFFLNRGQFSEAEAEYGRAVSAAPELESGHMNLGLALLQERLYPQAEAELMKALQLRTSSVVLLNLGSLYYAQEKFQQAADYYGRSLQEGGPSTMLLRNLGDAERHLGQKSGARDAYSQAKLLAEADVRKNPRRGVSHAILGLLNAFLGKADAAVFETTQALALNPEARSVMRDAAITFEYLGRRDDALAALRSATRPLLEEISLQPDLKELAKDSRFQKLFLSTPTQ